MAEESERLPWSTNVAVISAMKQGSVHAGDVLHHPEYRSVRSRRSDYDKAAACKKKAIYLKHAFVSIECICAVVWISC
jgi:hypothetical protein